MMLMMWHKKMICTNLTKTEITSLFFSLEVVNAQCCPAATDSSLPSLVVLGEP